MLQNSPPGVNHAQNKTPFEPHNDFISSLGFEGAVAIILMWVPLSSNSRCLCERQVELVSSLTITFSGRSRKWRVLPFFSKCLKSDPCAHLLSSDKPCLASITGSAPASSGSSSQVSWGYFTPICRVPTCAPHSQPPLQLYSQPYPVCQT